MSERSPLSERSVRVRVLGRVQGVWFRQSTRNRAEELGVRGWVRNLPDGSVEALLEGDPDAVESALAFVHEGPPRARVVQVQVEEVPAEGCQGFRVLPSGVA